MFGLLVDNDQPDFFLFSKISINQDDDTNAVPDSYKIYKKFRQSNLKTCISGIVVLLF